MLWVLGRFLGVNSFLVKLKTTILLSCIAFDSWFVLWFLSCLNKLSFFIVFDTCFVCWLFSSLNNLFYNILIDTWKENLAVWHIIKYDSIKWLFTDWFCLIIWCSTGSYTWTSLRVFVNDLEWRFHLTKLVTITLFICTFPTYRF